MPSRPFRVFLLLLSVAFVAGCGTSVHYIRPPDWRDLARRDSLIAAWGEHLQGVTIFIDPGHGGDDRASMGPEGDVVEADVNLRVALTLRDYLRQAGARVVMSRESDVTVPLASRAEQANVNNADIFLSIHHNAAANDETNYTATFYHARPGHIEYKASSHDLARYIQRDLAYVMGNPGPLASFDGTMSDFEIHPNAGFKVLRDTRMTAVLVECSFFSSRYEEQRLRIPEFNEIQAWGMFRGLARYLRAGIPTLRYVSPAILATTRPTLDIEVGARSDILDESIRVYIDGEEQGVAYNKKTNRITVSVSDELADGYHLLTAQVRNSGGNSSAPFSQWFAVGRPPVTLRSSAEPAVLPRDPGAFSVVTISALDSAGAPVRDGLHMRFTTSTGVDTMLTVTSGTARVAVWPNGRERVSFTASNGPVRTEGTITTSADALYTRGIIMGADGQAVRGAVVTLPGGRTAAAAESGEYVITGANPRGIEIAVGAPGWFTRREALAPVLVQDPIVLSPVAGGTLIGKPVLVELFTADAAKDGSRADWRALEQLVDLLEASGAVIVPLHGTASRAERDALLAKYKNAPLIQFGEQARKTVTVRLNGLLASRRAAEPVLRGLPAIVGAKGMDVMPQRVSPAGEAAGRVQIVLLLPRAAQRGGDSRNLPAWASGIGWAVYHGVLAANGFTTKGTRTVRAELVTKSDGTPAAYAPVLLNGTLRAYTDARGAVVFRGVTTNDDDVRPLDAAHMIKSVGTDIE